MDLVVDSNILFAVCLVKGKTEELFFSDDIHLFAPEFIFEEFEKYKQILMSRTKRSRQDFVKLIDINKNRIQLIPNEETERFIDKARKICPDKNDADFFALALKLNCPIWSNDKKLSEQKFIKIYTTTELVKLVL